MAIDLSKYKTAPSSPSLDPSKYQANASSTPKPQGGLFDNLMLGAAKAEFSTLKGLGTFGQAFLNNTAGRGVNLIRGKGFTPTNDGPDLYKPGSEASNKVNALLTPEGTAQNVGYGVEKVAEFATPVGIEKGLAAAGARLFPRLAESTSFLAKLTKLGGKSAASAAEQGTKALASGENPDSAAATTIAGAVAPLTPIPIAAGKGIFKAIKGSISPDVEQALTRAIKPGTNNTRWAGDLRLALPHIAQTAEQAGTPIKTIDELANGISQTKKRVWAAYAEKLGPNVNQEIDGNAIADAMIRSLDNRFVSQNPKAAEQIVQMAETYRRPIPLGEAEDFLKSANNDLHSYYAKNKVGQQAAKADPTVGHVVAEADALRTALYAKLDELSGETGTSASELKRVYGALTNIQEAAIKRANVAARQNTDSLAEQLSFAQGLMRIGKSAANLEIGDAIGGTVQMTAAKLMKDKNTTDALIEHAFTKNARKPVLPKAK